MSTAMPTAQTSTGMKSRPKIIATAPLRSCRSRRRKSRVKAIGFLMARIPFSISDGSTCRPGRAGHDLHVAWAVDGSLRKGPILGEHEAQWRGVVVLRRDDDDAVIGVG